MRAAMSVVEVFCALRMPDKPVKLVRKRLDAGGLIAHLQELAARATSLEVRVQGEAARTSDATAEPLDMLARRLVTGELVAVQIRFCLDDTWWSDTVLRARDGFRLVRMREGA